MSNTTVAVEGLIEGDTRRWFDILDELRSLNIGNDFPIPQIAVIGDQSSGKSSLLEALSGIPFPRGVGLVTRCPTCISMCQKQGSTWSADISISLQNNLGRNSNGESKFRGEGTVYTPGDLAERINSITEILCTDGVAGFSTDVIQVRVESPTVPNLTIVDLPGIVRTTTTGQSQRVITEVNNLLNGYMSQSRTIILAVIPANQDIATIDVLERAQNVDPMVNFLIPIIYFHKIRMNHFAMFI